jgi:hypothetical protein
VALVGADECPGPIQGESLFVVAGQDFVQLNAIEPEPSTFDGRSFRA